MKILIVTCVISFLTSCSSSTNTITKSVKNLTALASQMHHKNNASGQKVLTVGKKMVEETKEIVRGSCWDYINIVFNRAGYPQKKRVKVHKGTKNKGPYVNVNNIKPGDWLYYINHSYNGIEHSGIFVGWTNKNKKIANILSYGGEHRKKPGRYRDYDISNVYTIIRAKD